MNTPVTLKSDDPRLKTLPFKPYRSQVERRYERFEPKPGEPDRVEIATPWGESLTAKPGDYLISELDNPDDAWPIDNEIFEQTYQIVRPGICIKRALTEMVPLSEAVNGNSNAEVDVVTLEGVETVRAGDFYLARGVKGEIWPIPREKIGKMWIPAG